MIPLRGDIYMVLTPSEGYRAFAFIGPFKNITLQLVMFKPNLNEVSNLYLLHKEWCDKTTYDQFVTILSEGLF